MDELLTHISYEVIKQAEKHRWVVHLPCSGKDYLSKSENCKEKDCFKFLDVKLKSGMSKTSLKTNGKLSLE